MSYPITDEATADGVCRFNNFNNGAAVYWTPANGACLVYGAIYKKWMDLGAEAGLLGYPITDEIPSGNLGGRYNDFKGGSIYWSPTTPATKHLGALPDHLEVHEDFTFSDGVAAGGWVQITLFSNGVVQWKSHFHDSGLVDYDYVVGCVITDADGRAYTLGKGKAHISGTLSGGNRDDDWQKSVVSADVASNWRALVASMMDRGRADVSLDIGELINDIIKAIEMSVGVVTFVVSLF